jgi:hypothetical protein
MLEAQRRIKEDIEKLETKDRSRFGARISECAKQAIRYIQ